MRFVGVVCVCLLLLLAVTAVGNMVPQMQEAKADPSGQWYMIQMNTRTGYSSYMQVPLPASLYNTVKAWKDAGFSAVVIDDYLLREEPTYYIVTPNFDSGSGWYNYSVSGTPLKSVANFRKGYPSVGGGRGSARLYVKGTGKAMVSYYHSIYTAQSGRHTLDLYRTQILDRWHSYTKSFSGNVALGVEIRFTSGRRYVVYDRVGAGDYTNTSTTTYFKTLIDRSNRRPFTTLKTWLGYYEDATTVYDNPRFNITETYINLWGQTSYLSDKLFDFRWFVESFDSSSWVNAYFDVAYWTANRSWSSYIKDIQLAESSHGIIVIPGLSITTGTPNGTENEAIAVNINSGGITYDGTVPSYLTTPAQIADRGGLAFLEELYFFPNGTAYPNEASKSLVDWLGRGFTGFYMQPHDHVKNWDPALKVIFDEERTERMWIVKGSGLHGNYTQRALRTRYSMVYVEGTLTKQKIVDAIAAGHVQAVSTAPANEVVRTNLTIQDFSIGSWIMGDWATPSSSPVLNIDVRCDVPISNVILYWNGKILKSWFPYTKTFTQSLDVAMSGVFRLVAYDRYQNYVTIGNPIFLKPTIPYVKETTHPRDLTATFFDNKLAFTVSAPSGTTSTTQVYVGDKGEPTQVSTTKGTLTSSYNASTRILTLNVLHTGPANISVDWEIPGDVDGNGKVDASDLTELSEAYGSTPASPKWNPNCDFNRDNIISVIDLYPLGKNYGKTKP